MTTIASDSQTASRRRLSPRATMWIVWSLRLILGAVFIMSGLTKSIDLWGGTYKIEEYFMAWSLELPHSLYLMAAMVLSAAEFMLGAMLFVGAYRRSSIWLLLMMMAGMLPLTLYILIANPVSDCGCFGDFLVLSNWATFLKNVVITAGLIVLLKFNRLVPGIFNPYIQWLIGVLCLIYIVGIALWGYNIQPLIDFRSFPVGTEILPQSEDDSDIKFEFIYEKDGIRQSFAETELPDSCWTFIDRKIVEGSITQRTDLTVYEDGEDVTEDAISLSDPQLIVVVPDYHRASISYTYAINEMQRFVESIGGTLIELAAMPTDQIDLWRDLSMATYPIYQAEPTVLKELSRGTITIVYVVDGIIQWKRTLQSIDIDVIDKNPDKTKALAGLTFNGGRILLMASVALLALLLLIALIDNSRSFIKWLKNRRRKQKNE